MSLREDLVTLIDNALEDNINALKRTLASTRQELGTVTEWVCRAFSSQGKVLLFGNGGSAADAQHIAAEFVNRFRLDRRPLPAIALTTDTSILTAISNDYDYGEIFAKQVEALAQPGDVVIGISTSGNSPNVVNGLRVARQLGAKTVGLTGEKAGRMEEFSDCVLRAYSSDTPRIQEVHIFLAHLLCDLVERRMFVDNGIS